VLTRALLAIAALGLLLLAVAAACSAASTASVPSVSGTYALSVVDGTPSCKIAGVTEGTSTSDVPLTVSQDSVTPQNMTVVLGGNAGALLGTVMGSNILTGTLGGYQAVLTPESPDSGPPPMGMLDGCSYSAAATLTLNFAGDTVQGTLIYTLNTSGSSCQPLYNCQTVQALSGVLTPGAADASGGHDG
jgi:hypothetical protein